VKVLFPTMLWDRGTRQQGTPDPLALAKLLAQVGADGINGDTLDGVPHSFAMLPKRPATLSRSNRS
jgi:hypothetical protein